MQWIAVCAVAALLAVLTACGGAPQAFDSAKQFDTPPPEEIADIKIPTHHDL